MHALPAPPKVHVEQATYSVTPVRSWTRRLLGAFLVAVVAVVALPASVAYAHPPGPSDFQSRVVSIVPDRGWVAVSMIGGDSFVDLRVVPGHDVVVTGYAGERYLHFLADGSVEENVTSLTHYSNTSRFGGSVPAGIDASTPERWQVVAHGGHWAWHDHRSHWMNTFDPPGHLPGDVILEGVVRLSVDGALVDVTIQSTWMASPSPLVPTVCMLGGVLAVALLARRRLWLTAVLAATSSSALYVGIRQYSSVPAIVKPDQLSWLLPLAALCSLLPVLLARRRLPPWAVRTFEGFTAIELLLWVARRRLNLTRAILPTTMSYATDRAVTGACLGVAAATVVGVIVMSLRDVRSPRSSGQPAAPVASPSGS